MSEIKELFDALKKVPQSSIHHPEGDVFTHTSIVYDGAIYVGKGNISLFLAATFHDVGKLYTTVINENKISAHKHEEKSLEIYDSYFDSALSSYRLSHKKIARFVIQHHMRFKLLDEMRPSKVQKLKDDARDLYLECIALDNTIDSKYNPYLLLYDFAAIDSVDYFNRRFDGNPNHPGVVEATVRFEKSLDILQRNLRMYNYAKSRSQF